MKRRSVGILSLGCPRNLVDSEQILRQLCLKGYSIVDMRDASIGIVNTCAFIEDAKKESVEAILGLIDLKKQGKLKKVIVYGCLAQRYKDELCKELPEVDAFIGKISLDPGLNAEKAAFVERDKFSITPRHYAYLKIAEGCINNCSYCVIPRIKGRFTSVNEQALLRQVAQLDSSGVKELNIIGQDISGYGIDLGGSFRLPELLRSICGKSKHIPWLRLLYLYPSRISDELLAVIKDEPRICKYIDVPLQHINERILRLMNRNTGKKDILRLIEKIRNVIPSVTLRTSVIVGFPSETDKEFKELLRFIKSAKFEKLGAFMYSREEETPAFDFDKQVPKKIKVERFNEVMALQQEISLQNNEKFMGQELPVLIDEKEDDYYLGRSQGDAPEVDGLIYIYPSEKNKRIFVPGDFVNVRIHDTLEYDLVGTVSN
ncbi:MAG: 30S ribosomal protein S12 methylthiotransferase RimO [Candidatus Omnitrophota bacterium]|jgi:ribosomal protein S12 methylthiotransferase